MELQKVINLSDNTTTYLSKFRTGNWIEIKDDAHGTYNKNSRVKFKTAVLKSSLCNYSEGLSPNFVSFFM